MIQRLLDALVVLAAEGRTQEARYGALVGTPGRLLPELSDALLLMESCQQETLTDDQRDALHAVEAYLENECESADFWTKSALSTDPRWSEVRRLAGRALRALGRSG
jgi:hypothetical protein